MVNDSSYMELKCVGTEATRSGIRQYTNGRPKQRLALKRLRHNTKVGGNGCQCIRLTIWLKHSTTYQVRHWFAGFAVHTTPSYLPSLCRRKARPDPGIPTEIYTTNTGNFTFPGAPRWEQSSWPCAPRDHHAWDIGKTCQASRGRHDRSSQSGWRRDVRDMSKCAHDVPKLKFPAASLAAVTRRSGVRASLSTSPLMLIPTMFVLVLAQPAISGRYNRGHRSIQCKLSRVYILGRIHPMR